MKLSKYILVGSLLSAALLLTSPSVKANYWAGGFATGVLTYGVGPGGSASIASTAVQQWNGVSSKVKLSYSSATNQYGSTASIVTYFNSERSATTGQLGRMYPYSSYTGISASPASDNSVFVKALAFQYVDPLLNSDTRRIGTATHEIGHALSLDHVWTNAVMEDGVKDFYTLKSSDINNLKWKWGN